MGDKKKGKAEKITVDGVETSELKFPKLQEFAAVLLNKLNTARKDRNFLQVQCTQMRTAWEMTKMKLQDSKYEIKVTAMNRDKKEVEVCGEVMKEMNHLGKFIKYNLNERLNQTKDNTTEIVKDMDSKWDQNTLNPLIEQKISLKQNIEKTNENNNNMIKNFQEQIDNDVSNFVSAMDRETEQIIDNQIKRLIAYVNNIKLISETSFFRTQEEYNRIIREMIENGRKNKNMMREFYKRITEDDIIMIMVLERQVRKLKRIVTKKHVMCKKINEQSAIIESSKGELDMNLSRAKRKMKLYDTNTLALDRANFMCDKLTEKKNMSARELKESISRENEINDKFKKMRDHINMFHVLFEKRQIEVFEPLQIKLSILNSLIKKDRNTIEILLQNLPPESQVEARKVWESSDSLTSKCMTYLTFDMARLCNTHDSLIDFVEGGLISLSIPQKDRSKFKKINFDATSYGLGPIGLITKYP